MSFRIEEKILLNVAQDNLLNDFLNKNNAIKIHENRIVSSIYFDNKFLQMFKDSEEGCVPRKKIRLRRYTNSNLINYEIKISSVEGRFKITKNINEKDYLQFIKNGIFDNNYGMCYPVVSINYQRQYLSVKSKRLTVDSNVEYQDYVSKKVSRDNFNKILEIKTLANDDINKLYVNFPFRRSRFSKYSAAIIRLKIKN
jgi:hypothetical protein